MSTSTRSHALCCARQPTPSLTQTRSWPRYALQRVPCNMAVSLSRRFVALFQERVVEGLRSGQRILRIDRHFGPPAYGESVLVQRGLADALAVVLQPVERVDCFRKLQA